ncbi:hypothetical protein [Gelidibacter maritimus]|nr:hypothetical protein [Gelidibacter maritimus]
MKLRKRFSITTIILLFMMLTSCTDKTLPIKEFNINMNGSASFISLADSGEVHAFSMQGDSEKVGTLHANGELKNNDGKLLATIDEDGFVYDADTNKMVQINDTGDIDNGSGQYLSWSDDGKFSMQQGGDFLQLNPNDKDLRKSASFLIFVMMSLNSVTTDMSDMNIDEND